MNLQRSRLGKPDDVRVHLHPHLHPVVKRTGNRTERTGLIGFGYGRLGLILLAVSHERDPPVNSARGGASGECDHQSGTDRNTKIHCDRLTDDAAGCKPYPMSPEWFMRRAIVSVTVRGIVMSAVLLFTQTEFSVLGQSAKIILPTENHALLTGDYASFYQYVKRDFEGQVGDAWEGGQYGFVRNPRRIGTAVLYARFHEGIDIRPLLRDTNGEPLDVVHAVAAGKVVYTNTVPAYSNYGRYIVIEHQLDGCPYYSLYAHLSAIRVKTGDPVAQSDPIGVMGHTGEGIDRERAHLHLELNLLLNADFDRW